MGHSRIGTLPRTRRWKQVISLIGGGADVLSVAAATTAAAEISLERHAGDAVLHQAFYLLTQVPLAARGDDAVDGFRRIGLLVGAAPDLVEIVSALMSALDRVAGKTAGRQSDLTELAKLAAAESLSAIAGNGAASLLGDKDAVEATRLTLAGLASPRQFGVLARDFLSRLMRRCLDYHLSRELPNHVGVNGRFQSLRDHREFEDALDAHCRETARITEIFASEWFSKANYEGGITPQKAGGFIRHAFSKLRAEMRERGQDAPQAA